MLCCDKNKVVSLQNARVIETVAVALLFCKFLPIVLIKKYTVMKRTKVLMMLSIVALIFGCEESNELDKMDCQTKTGLKTISFDNFLTFSSFEEMESRIEQISAMTFEQQISEEVKENFASVDRIFSEISSAEEEIMKPYENLSVEELTAIPRVTSATHDEYADILIVDTLDGGFLLESMNAYEEYSKVLNRKSIVKVGNKIYQFKKYMTKIIEDGDAKKIDILDNINITDTNLNVTVINHKFVPNAESHVLRTAYKTSGPYRVDLQNEFCRNLSTRQDFYETSFMFRVSLSKKFLGLWYFQHKAKQITLEYNMTGNEVQGYRVDDYGNFVQETHSWCGRKICSTLKCANFFLGFQAATNPNVRNPHRIIHYNTAAELPIINRVQNIVTVKCSDSRTISFTMTY